MHALGFSSQLPEFSGVGVPLLTLPEPVTGAFVCAFGAALAADTRLFTSACIALISFVGTGGNGGGAFCAAADVAQRQIVTISFFMFVPLLMKRWRFAIRLVSRMPKSHRPFGGG
jgi:hypothetical protein